jgi:hypothetical protein
MSVRMKRHFELLGLWLGAYRDGVKVGGMWKYQARYRRYLQLAFVVAGERSL